MILLLACAEPPPPEPRWAGGQEVDIALQAALTPYYTVGDALHLRDVSDELACATTDGDTVVLEGPCAWNDSVWTGRATVALDGGSGTLTLEDWARSGGGESHVSFLGRPENGPWITLDGTFTIDGWDSRGDNEWRATLDGAARLAVQGTWPCGADDEQAVEVSAEWSLAGYDAFGLGAVHASRIAGEVSDSTVGAYAFTQYSQKRYCDYMPDESSIAVEDGEHTIDALQEGCTYWWEWHTSDEQRGWTCG